MLKRTLTTVAMVVATGLGTAMAIPTTLVPNDYLQLAENPNLDPALKTSPAGTKIVANLTQKQYSVFAGDAQNYAVNGIAFGEPEEINPDLTWSKTFGIGVAYGPVLRANQSPYPGVFAYYEKDTMSLASTDLIVGIWMHDDNFFDLAPGGSWTGVTGPNFGILAEGPSSPTVSGLVPPGYSPYIGYTIGPVDLYGNAYVSFAAPIDYAYFSGPTSAGYSLLDLVGEDSKGKDALASNNHVPDNGSTLILLATGLLGIVSTAALARNDRSQLCPIRSSQR